MKFLLSSVLILLTFSGSAQKIRFTDHRNSWKTAADGADCVYANRYYFYGTDTTIHGNRYNRMLTRSEFSPSDCIDFLFEYPGDFYIREDTIANKVYYLSYNVIFSPDTFDHILYDYTLNVGDSIAYGPYGIHTMDSVTGIDSIFISGIKYKIFHLQNMAGYGTGFYTIVEGLGCTGSPILPTFFVACFEYEERVLCFNQNSYYPPFNIPVNDLCAGWGGDTLNNNLGCLTLSRPIQNKKELIVNFNPNPADDLMLISTNVPFSPHTTLNIYDITGKNILSEELPLQTQYKMNTSNLPNGMYMCIIQDYKGILQKQKIVISH